MELKVPPPIVTAIFVLMMWGVSVSMAFASVNMHVPAFLSWALVIVAIAIDIYALISFRVAKTTINPLKPKNASQLVIVGIYRYTRNPMYLGMFVILLAFVIWFSNIINIGLLFLFVLYLNKFQIIPEERALSELFGSDYTHYKKEVRRWL